MPTLRPAATSATGRSRRGSNSPLFFRAVDLDVSRLNELVDIYEKLC